jgi:hypothetical protein
MAKVKRKAKFRVGQVVRMPLGGNFIVEVSKVVRKPCEFLYHVRGNGIYVDDATDKELRALTPREAGKGKG